MSTPNVYSITWDPNKPATRVSQIVRLFVPPVAGGHVLIPFEDGTLKRCLVKEVVPIGYSFGRQKVDIDDYAADIVLQDPS